MKKIFAVLIGVSILASCNREADSVDNQGTTLSPAELGLKHFTRAQLDKDFTPLNESANLNGKMGSQLNYTFRGYANPVEDDFGTTLAASAICQVDDMIFVAWHTNDNGAAGSVSGSLCAYRLSGIGQYELMDRVDFDQHDWYGVAGHRNNETGNIEVFVTGQRNTSSSQYVLANHKGAVVSRIDYDYINDEFWEGGIEELPLPGLAGTDIIALGANYFVSCGDGVGGVNAMGGVYQVDRSLRNVLNMDVNITDAVDLELDERTVTPTGGDFYVLDRDAAPAPTENVFIKHYSFNGFGVNYNGIIAKNGDHYYIPVVYNTPGDPASGVATAAYWDRDLDNDISPVAQGKGHIVLAQGKKGASGSLAPAAFTKDSLLTVYGNGTNSVGYVYKARGGQDVTGSTPSSPSLIDRSMAMGKFSAMTFDPFLGVLYCGGGDADAGISVMAMGEFSGDALPLDPKPFVSTHDLVGKLVLPSSVNSFDNLGTPIVLNLSNKAVNDISVYQTRHIAVSLGDNGLMFIQKNH
jgi:hypothetical protein